MARRLLTLAFSLLLIIILVPKLTNADGTHLLQRSLKLSNNTASASAIYRFGFQPVTTATIQQVSLQFCANDPLPDTSCDPPTGLDVSHAVLTNQSGDQGFTISPLTTANRLMLQRSPFSSNAQLDNYEFSGVINPSSNGSYYVRVQTYQDSDLSSANNYGGIAFAIANSVNITATVPPYLLFCVAVTVNGYTCDNTVGNYVNFGEFGSRQASQGTTQMLAASNAKDGYNIRVNGPTLTSGNNIITNLVGADVSRPGVGQFGMNLRANSSPQGGLDTSGSGSGLPTNGYNQINFYRFNSGDIVAASTGPDLARKYTSTYLVNVPKDQAPGVYVSTLTYLCLGSY